MRFCGLDEIFKFMSTQYLKCKIYQCWICVFPSLVHMTVKTAASYLKRYFIKCCHYCDAVSYDCDKYQSHNLSENELKYCQLNTGQHSSQPQHSTSDSEKETTTINSIHQLTSVFLPQTVCVIYMNIL